MATKKRTQTRYLDELAAAQETVRLLLNAGTHSKHEALLDAVALHEVSYCELDQLVQAEVQT